MLTPLAHPLLLCVLSLVCGVLALRQTSQTWSSPESAYVRDYFMAGGSYTDDGTGEGTHAFQGQMYVERLAPVSGANRSYPLVFVHGTGQTGTVRSIIHICTRSQQLTIFLLKNFLNTPDGRKGWASWLIDHGYEVGYTSFLYSTEIDD